MITDDWLSIGVTPGVPYHEIDRIRQLQNGYDKKDRLTRIISMWLKSGSCTSQEDLVKAWKGFVEAICHLSVAQRIFISDGVLREDKDMVAKEETKRGLIYKGERYKERSK